MHMHENHNSPHARGFQISSVVVAGFGTAVVVDGPQSAVPSVTAASASASASCCSLMITS